MSIKTHTVLAFRIQCAVICTPYATVFRTLRGWYESMDALTIWSTVHDLAECVGAARVFAWIHTAMFMTDGMHWTILGAGAVSLWLAAIRVRITHVIRRAPTHRFIRRTSDAERRRMTGIRTTRLDGDALDVGHRIWAQSGRALADRLVVIRDANGIHSARVLVAGVVAGVREPVAKLRRRAIDVVDAGHRAATGRRVIRIASV